MNRLLSCSLAAAFLLCGHSAGAVEYRFTNIADSTTTSPSGATFDRFEQVAISGSTVAFVGSYAAGGGIFTGSGGPLTTIVLNGNPGPVEGPGRYTDPAISGELVAFSGAFGDILQTSGIFAGSGGPITTVVLERDPAPAGAFISFGPPAASGDQVAFRATYNGGSGSESQFGVFVASGGAISTIARQGDPAPAGTFRNFLDVGISDNSVAFLGYDAEGGGIYTGNGGALSKIVRPGDPATIGVFSGVAFPSISDNAVAFQGGDSEGSGIFVHRNGELTTIVRTFNPAPMGIFDEFGKSAVGGDSVAFSAQYDEAEKQGIFVGSGGPVTTVIKSGDPLFGSTLENFSNLAGDRADFGFDPDGSGNLAFVYTLADGRVGIALATIVPEPTSLFLNGVSLGVLFSMLRMRLGRNFASNQRPSYDLETLSERRRRNRRV